MVDSPVIPLIPIIFCYWTDFCHFHFFFQAHQDCLEGVHLGLGLGVGGILISVLGLGLDLGLDIRIGVEMDADSVVNLFFSCCLDIFS